MFGSMMQVIQRTVKGKGGNTTEKTGKTEILSIISHSSLPLQNRAEVLKDFQGPKHHYLHAQNVPVIDGVFEIFC